MTLKEAYHAKDFIEAELTWKHDAVGISQLTASFDAAVGEAEARAKAEGKGKDLYNHVELTEGEIRGVRAAIFQAIQRNGYPLL